MNPVNERMHALLARELIAACGGLDEAAAEGVCRLKRSRLSECQVAGSGAYLPIDVVADPEAYCGRPIYSRALVDARPAAANLDSLVEGACGAAEAAVDLQREIRTEAAGGKLSPRQRTRIDAAILGLEERLRELRAVNDGAGS